MNTRPARPLSVFLLGVAATFLAALVFTSPAQTSSREESIFAYSDSATVSQAQAILKHMGLLAPGSYQAGQVDPVTEKALRSFQMSHNLRITGRLDRETLAELLQHRPAKAGDADGDGVTDDRDRCPDTPRGVKVDASGCTADTDGDGVSDDRDRCPGTPRGAKVDAHGCPEPEPKPEPVPKPEPEKRPMPEAGKPLVLEGVNFATNSATLTHESLGILDSVADSLKAHPDVRVEVGGYTSHSGTKKFNERLSQMRADAVRDYLIGKGVPASRLTAVGHGWSHPIADNETAEGRAKNQRVELSRID